jgi:uncharacterized protein YraI
MPRSLAFAALAALTAVLPAWAAAQQASAINPVALRAGPDAQYPFVASYDAGTPLRAPVPPVDPAAAARGQ